MPYHLKHLGSVLGLALPSTLDLDDLDSLAIRL
jgi:hypothetical protein